MRPRKDKNGDLESMVKKTYETALVLADEHYAYVNPRMVEIAEAYLRETRPKYRVHLGDLFDNPAMSVFDQDPYNKRNTQEEIDEVVQYLNRLYLASPTTKTVVIFGNHDYSRLERQKGENSRGVGSLRNLELPKLIAESAQNQGLEIGDVEYHKAWRMANCVTFVHGDPRIDARIKGGQTGPRRTAETFPGDDHIIMGHKHRMIVARDQWKDREVHHVAAMLDVNKANYNTMSQYENGLCVVHYNPQVRPRPHVVIQNQVLRNNQVYLDGKFW